MKKAVNTAGLTLIEQWEGFRPTMYKDVAGFPTIGFGTLIDTEEEKYLLKATITREQARELLMKDMNEAIAQVNKMVVSNVNTNQFNALVSFAYNLGWPTLKKSTLLKEVNKHPFNAYRLPVAELKDKSVQKYLMEEKKVTSVNIITYWFLVYNRAGGRTITGLLHRRWHEAELYWRKDE